MKLEDKIYNYPTKYKEGFTHKEIEELLKEYTINREKFDDALVGITCMMKDELIIYHCDVLNALRCGIENRGLRLSEWD